MQLSPTLSDVPDANPVVLEARDIVVDYAPSAQGRKRSQVRQVLAVNQVSLSLKKGEVLGLVGESGSGKSTLAYALLNLLTPPGHLVGGDLRLGSTKNLYDLPESQWENIRGRHIALVAQASQSVFNPIMRLGVQFKNILAAHGVKEAEGVARARELLAEARLPADRIFNSYPHELSGGMRQRVTIVASVMTYPEVVVLDEPTTALDVLSQAVVLESLRTLRRAAKAPAMMFISPNFAVISQFADRVGVMYAGRMVEMGSVAQMYQNPRHPYTKALVKSVPVLRGNQTTLAEIPGTPPDLKQLPSGCPFHPRCASAMDQCSTAVPAWTGDAWDGVACYLYSSTP
ncbi:MAG: ABC transporter ATP-binding protein [Firmicutes bacterium]|nr:ABC transporter ATP-binding protein [Bacillota bacterium]